MMLEETLPENLIAETRRILERHKYVAVVVHTHPDGDAVGSSLALNSLLKGLGKKVSVLMETRPSDAFSFLQDFDRIIIAENDMDRAKEAIQNASLLCCLDFNDWARVGKTLQEAIQTSTAEKLVIDHHLSFQMEGDVVISRPDMSSTSELLFHVVKGLGFFADTSKKFAEAIYTGIVCDTGNFAYNSNSPSLYLALAELLGKGIDKDDIYDKVFRGYSFKRMQLMGLLLHRKMRVYPNCHTALISLTSKEMLLYNHQAGDAEGFANLPLNIKGIFCSVFLREEPGKIKVSLRSKGNFDVDKLARKFYNGGGHKNAAGGELYCPMEQAIEHFMKKLPLFKKEAVRAIELAEETEK